MESSYKRKYRTDARFYLAEKYRDMKKRVSGKPVGNGTKCPWLGMEIADKEEFIQFGLNDPEFNRLFKERQDHNFTHYGPNVHRIDRVRGYTIDNIKFLSHDEKGRMHLEQGRVNKDKKKARV